jgi:Tfp pilus assembly protein PilF
VSQSGSVAPPPTASAEAAGPSRWIISAGWDIVLFIGTPALILPLMWLSRQRFSDQTIYALVTAFGATGHHLPGMMRAYGDRALFRRFRLRFTLVPALLLAVSLPLLFTELRQGMMVVLLFWGFWHGLMQVYGFVRIYDAKVGQHDARTATLDWWLCFAWFGAGLVNSDGRMFQILEVFYQTGGPVIPANWFGGFRTAWNALTLLITLGFLGHLVGGLSRNRPANPVKLATLALSIAYWWFAMVMIDNIVIGLALFEIFHDVQYLAIVWVFNQKRVDSDPDVGSFSQFLFRRSWAMLGLYVGLVLGYGFLGNLQAQTDIKPLQNTLVALVWTSTLLHFYLDGFVWKVRERGTQKGLGIDDPQGTDDSRPLTEGMIHAMKWIPFVGAVLLLTASQWWQRGVHATPEERDRLETLRYERLVQAVPTYDHAHLTLGTRRAAAGDFAAARRSFTFALKFSHDNNAAAHYNLGLVLAGQKEFAPAIEHYKKSLSLDPRSVESHFALAAALQSQSQTVDAEKHFLAALEFNPDFAAAHLGLGGLYRSTGQFQQAEQRLLRAIELLEGTPGDGRDLRAARDQLRLVRDASR